MFADFQNLVSARRDKAGYDLGTTPFTTRNKADLTDANDALMTQGGYSIYLSRRMTKPGNITQGDYQGDGDCTTWAVLE